MVPKCAFAAGARNIILAELATSTTQFALIRDNELMALYRVER